MMIDGDLARVRKRLDETKGITHENAEETHRLLGRIAQLTFAVWLQEGPTNPVPQYDLIVLARMPRPSRLAIESIVDELNCLGGRSPDLEASLASLTSQERREYELVREQEKKRFWGVKPIGWSGEITGGQHEIQWRVGVFLITEFMQPADLGNDLIRERASYPKGKRSRQFLARVNGREAGYLCYDDRSDMKIKTGVPYEVFVLPEFRRQGVGSRVLSFAEELALSLNCSRMRLRPTSFDIDQSVTQEQRKSWFTKMGYRLACDGTGEFEKSLLGGDPSGAQPAIPAD
jgi:GNAT superfamily N-acetyltransferase